MIEVKYTPGPWFVEAVGNFIQVMNGEEGERSHIATLFTSTMDNKEQQPFNAKLIAASPIMYSEMVRYYPILERLERDFPEVWDKLTKGTGIATRNGYKNAIQKATL
jgi:hypothetical protein